MSQKRHRVEMVKGEWVVSDDITIAQAREKAIGQAKLEALREAGVPEIISESNLSYKSESAGDMQDLFESLTTVDIFGEISDYKIVREEKKLNEVGNISYTVWINATVIIHKDSKDPGFGWEVEGIREKYGSPDKLSFAVKPWKDSYLRVFIVSDKEGVQLYPNKYEKQEMLKGETKLVFPRSKGFEYEVSTEKGSEINYLILLLTKQDIPFMDIETPENILRYISRISPGQKALKTYTILIKSGK